MFSPFDEPIVLNLTYTSVTLILQFCNLSLSLQYQLVSSFNVSIIELFLISFNE